jgi:acetylornithine/N-succinyldiaminopimelate aminotransferase
MPFAPLHDPEVFPSHVLMEITARPPIVFTEGRGSWLTDRDGRKYLDFVQGWAVNCLGHCPPQIVQAIAVQAATLINPSPAFYNAPAIALAARLTRASGLDRVFFANSGAEANESAIKLARKWGAKHRNGAFEIITMAHGFHGRTLATMSASGKPQWSTLFEPKVPGFPKVPLNNLDALAGAIGDRTAAVMLEPVQGESGVVPATDDYLRDVRRLTQEHGILLILDEVQTGTGRTGKMYACQHAGIRPDIMTLGKGLGGGVPLAAMLATEAVCCFEHGDQGGTYNGNPLMTAVGCAVHDAITEPGFLEAVCTKGQQLRSGLEALSARFGLAEVRGRGLLVALDLHRDLGGEIVTQARERGLLINAPRPATLRFMPALNVTDGELDQMLATLEEVLSRVTQPA